ncbi:hypothetical protein SO694_00225011 [Aureococcus anophagefferens]|uniref:Uncharacterized protein n=1 Tax=Aureococcus anophagefferens TaxID=44056 RepID=A0ABR1G588_AURAN
MLHRNVRFDGSSTVDASATPAAPAATATERLAAAAATTWSWSASPAARPVPPSRAPGPDLEVCYGARHRSKTAAAFVDAFAPDVTVTAAGNGARGIVRADESLALDVFGRGARALFARGSSYVTIELDRATDVELGSAGGVASVVQRWRAAGRAGGEARRPGAAVQRREGARRRAGAARVEAGRRAANAEATGALARDEHLYAAK